MLGNIQTDFGPFTDSAQDRESRANPPSPFPHAGDSMVTGLPQVQRLLIDSPTIILHAYTETTATVTEQDMNPPCIGVLEGVRDCLPSNLQDVLASDGIQRPFFPFRQDVYVGSFALWKVIGDLRKGSHQVIRPDLLCAQLV